MIYLRYSLFLQDYTPVLMPSEAYVQQQYGYVWSRLKGSNCVFLVPLWLTEEPFWGGFTW